MDGIHDLGGKHGHGKVVDHPPGERYPGFAQRWHGVMMAVVNKLLTTGVAPNVDYFRHAIERIDPVSYLDDGYYGRWLGGVETMLVEAGVLTQDEISARAGHLGAQADTRIAARPEGLREQYPPPGATTGHAGRECTTPALFNVGDWVVTTPTAVSGHTRLPGYARAARGQVVAWHNTWVFPDTNAHGRGECATHLYTVQFVAAELWGADTEPGVEVCLDLFEPYLEKIDE